MVDLLRTVWDWLLSPGTHSGTPRLALLGYAVTVVAFVWACIKGIPAWLGWRAGRLEARLHPRLDFPYHEETGEPLLENEGVRQWRLSLVLGYIRRIIRDAAGLEVNPEERIWRDRRLLIVGPQGTGKTREALECVRRIARRYPDVKVYRTDTIPVIPLENTLPADFPPKRLVLLLDDVHKHYLVDEADFAPQAGAGAPFHVDPHEMVAGAIGFFSARCDEAWIIATARKERLGLMQREGRRVFWGGFVRWETAPTEQRAQAEWLDVLAAHYAVQLTGPARGRILRVNHEGFENLDIFMRDNQGQRVDESAASLFRATCRETWQDILNRLCDRTRGGDPNIRHIYWALSVLGGLDIAAHPELVFRLAATQVRRTLGWRRSRAAQAALAAAAGTGWLARGSLGAVAIGDFQHCEIGDVTDAYRRVFTLAKRMPADVLEAVGDSLYAKGLTVAGTWWRALGHRNPRVRAREVALLSWLGGPAATELVLPLALKDPSSMVRREALCSVGYLRAERVTPDVVQDVVQSLRLGISDEDADVRKAACVAARDLAERAATPEVVSALQAALSDTHAAVRAAAWDALPVLGEDCALQPVRRAFVGAVVDPDPRVRLAACRAFAKLKSVAKTCDVVAALGRALSDEEPRVRKAACNAVGELGEIAAASEIMVALGRALADSEFQVRWAACRAAGRLDGKECATRTVPALRQALSDEDPCVRLAAAQALIRLADEATRTLALGVFVRAAADERQMVREAACVVIGRLAEKAAIPGLIAVLQDAGEDAAAEVRAAAREAQDRLGLRDV